MSLFSGYPTDIGPNLRTTTWSALPMRRQISSTSCFPRVSSLSTSSRSSGTSPNGSQVVASTKSLASGGTRYSTLLINHTSSFSTRWYASKLLISLSFLVLSRPNLVGQRNGGAQLCHEFARRTPGFTRGRRRDQVGRFQPLLWWC